MKLGKKSSVGLKSDPRVGTGDAEFCTGRVREFFRLNTYPLVFSEFVRMPYVRIHDDEGNEALS